MYVSTRGGKEGLSASEAIQAGIAKNGGLLVPDTIPLINQALLANFVVYDYKQRAVHILQHFLTDYSTAELENCVAVAYGNGKFDCAEVAPMVALDEKCFVLELWHGPTSAFKDMALQLLPQLLSQALKKTGEKNKVVILVATSGDTGKAALEGFKDVKQTEIIVFYPQQGVSEIQRLQMITQQGNNVAVVGVNGNFDDAQTGVKNIFSDDSFNDELQSSGYRLSSANSINWGRLVPQIVYYFSAYADMVASGHISTGQPVNFIVPTGNFGNILAGYYAKLMGLPVNRLICASNSNNVLTDFLRTGKYDRRRAFFKTVSPSMDILISSNLERLLYHITSQDTEQVALWMKQLKEDGVFDIGSHYLAAIQKIFWADWVDDEQTLDMINEIFSKYQYVADTHTAVAWRVNEVYRQKTGDSTPYIIVSTASPFKFNDSVLTAINGADSLSGKSEFDMLRELEQLSGFSVPAELAALETAKICHERFCQKDSMRATVKEILKIF